MNDTNNEKDKVEECRSQEVIKSLEIGEKTSEKGDKSVQEEKEPHETPALEVDGQASSKEKTEVPQGSPKTVTTVKTDEHSEKIVDGNENDQNELNNKTKEIENLQGNNVKANDNVESNERDDDKEGSEDNKDQHVANEIQIKDDDSEKSGDSKDQHVANEEENENDNEKLKNKDNKKETTEESAIESENSNTNDEFPKQKKTDSSSLAQEVVQSQCSSKDENDNKEYNGENNENRNEPFAEVNEEIGDGEFEDVEIPEEIDELILPDGAGDADVCNVEDDDDNDDAQDKTSNDDEIIKDNDTTAEDGAKPSKSSEEEESCHSALEPELVAIEEATKTANCLDEDQSTNDDEGSNITASDPLNCLEIPVDESNSNGAESHTGDGQGEDSHTGDGNGKDSNSGNGNDEDSNNVDGTIDDSNTGDGTGHNNKEDDDDDVQFVETRNSPICIESDDEEPSDNVSANVKETQNSSPITTVSNNESVKQTITLPSSTTITLPKNLTITRTSARKSTARPQYTASPPTIVPQTQNRDNSFAYLAKATTYRQRLAAAIPRQVVDTIELLDSSDEETTSSGQQNKSLPAKFKTPPKRTLLAAKSVNSKSPAKASLVPRGGMFNNISAQIRKQPKKPAPPPLPPPTPQSNFLNAVQLQPATAGVNPPAFSALLSNKSVIIPNAFYGNPPGVRGNSADAELERRYARWLDNFITQFCNPQLVASHSCFVFLQRALKYKDFVRIKSIRTSLNINAQTATDQLNHQLMLDLRSIFLKNSKEITTHGRRFCELTCSMIQNKSVTLLVHAVTNRVIMKTCNMEIPKSNAALSSSSPSTSNNTSSSSNSRKRPLYEEDEEEYVPGKNKIKSKPQSAAIDAQKDEEKNDGDGGTKRSLRSKRTKRLDNSFSYNEDDLAEYDIEDDEETAERLAQEEIQRKIEQKRLEAQIQRQKQAKSFESAFLEVFAKSLENQASNASTTNNTRSASGQRVRINNTSTMTSAAHQALYHNDAEDLLQATWIENVENEDTQVISDDDEPREHRVYKQKRQQQQLQRYPTNESHRQQGPNLDPRNWPKNTDTSLYATSKNKDICVICKLSVQRIVHHYVNEHRGCEVYNSRLSPYQLEHLKRGASNVINVSIYKNGQPQFEAHCIFCQKLSRFMLPYWFQHFTMHTGEYAYRCSGCGVRKPTRSLLTQHQSQGNCPQGGNVLQDYTHDVKKVRVEARICTLCNYVQLHRSNIVKHLHLQHNIKQILPKHIQTIVLLKDQSAPGPSAPTPEITITRRKQSIPTPTALSRNASYVIDDDDDDDTLLFAEDALPPMQYQQQQQQQQHQQQQQATATNAQNQYYNYIPPYMMNNSNHQNFTWEDNDPSDDLSFMICGMLDVQMNTE